MFVIKENQLYPYNTAFYVYDTDDSSLERWNRVDIDRIFKQNRDLFYRGTEGKSLNQYCLLLEFNILPIFDSDIVEVCKDVYVLYNDNTNEIFLSVKGYCYYVDSIAPCYTIVPVLSKGSKKYLSLCSLYDDCSKASLYSLGKMTLTQIKRSIMMGKSFENMTSLQPVYFNINIKTGMPERGSRSYRLRTKAFYGGKVVDIKD